MTGGTFLLRELRRAISWHRRLLAAGLAAGSLACALAVLRPPSPAGVRVLAAAADLPGGTRLTAADLATVALPPAAVPAGALRPGAQAEGRVLAGPMRRGEPLTDARLVGPALLMDRDLVATPVRIADAAVARLLHAGDRVDVLAASTAEAGDTPAYGDLADDDPDGGDPPSRGERADDERARIVAPAVRVLTVPRADDGWPGADGAGPGAATALGDGALVVLATTPGQAAELARAAVTSRLSVTLRPG